MNNSPVKSELYVALEMVELTQFLSFTKKTVFYERLKKVKDFISSNCQRTKPSARDALKLKDMILLVNSIIHNKPITTLEA